MYIKSLHLEDVKGFGDLHFDFERPDKSFAGWTVFVGGNASGKSTILKSMALALLGPDSSRELMGNPSLWTGWFRGDSRRAEVTTELVWDSKADKFRKGGAHPGQTFEAAMRFVREGDTPASRIPALRPAYKRTNKSTRILTPERGPWAINSSGWFSAGYGPMRRLTGSSSESVRYSLATNNVSRYVTLFREDAALSESETWLKNSHSRWLESQSETLKYLNDSVAELLSDDLLPRKMKIDRVTVDHVYVKDARGLTLPMQDISDGCRGIYATVLDLIHGMDAVYGTSNLFGRHNDGSIYVKQPGVVLIDEVEAHLHPSWQRTIPDWFKKHFPCVQFFVTTHSPLVAQSADPNGAFLLPSFGDVNSCARPMSDGELERLRLGRAEKTLLGVAFGLQSSRSTWAAKQIEKWQFLNAKTKAGVPLTSQEHDAYSGLQQEMQIAFELPGETA